MIKDMLYDICLSALEYTLVYNSGHTSSACVRLDVYALSISKHTNHADLCSRLSFGLDFSARDRLQVFVVDKALHIVMRIVNRDFLFFSRPRSKLFFFFQAEDGIRDYKVTGVQTCALPI